MQQFNCPHCGGLFRVDADISGRQVACPNCGRHVLIPAPPAAAEREPRSEPPADVRRPAAPWTGNPPVTDQPKAPAQRFSPPMADAGRLQQPVLPDPMAPATPAVGPADSENRAEQFPPEAIRSLESETGIDIQDRPKTIVHKGRVIELRRLSAKEKARRRLRRRLVLILIGGAVLIFYMLYGAGRI